MTKSANYFGLTGGIACGKTTAANFFKQLGAHIINADQTGHDFLLSSGPAYGELLRAFGEGILDQHREIDRQRLGALVFSDPQKLQQLNSILHPPIICAVEEKARALQVEAPNSVVIVDAALIFESGIGGHFAKVITVWCRPGQQMERLMAKNQFSREQAEARIQSQMSAEEKRRRADFVIDTSGSIESTRQQIEALFPRLQTLAARSSI